MGRKWGREEVRVRWVLSEWVGGWLGDVEGYLGRARVSL